MMQFIVTILLLISLSAVIADNGGASCATGPACNARELQKTPLWINIPVPPEALEKLVPAPLKPDVYKDGNAYITFLTYNLDPLEIYYGKWLGFLNFPKTTGWVSKFTILVKDPIHGKQGYLITSIDFQNDISGGIRSGGAVLQQQLSSHLCSFDPKYSSTSTQLSFKFQCDYLDADFAPHRDGFEGSSAYVKGAGSGLSNDFVKWITQRNFKYVKKSDGSVQYADVTYPGIEKGLNEWYSLSASTTWKTNILSERLGLSDNYPICKQAGQCFWASYYGLIDHANIPITASLNSINADGELLIAPDTTITTTSTSTNMIWLYGILVGFGSAVIIATILFVVIRYRARGKQAVHTTTQHVEMP